MALTISHPQLFWWKLHSNDQSNPDKDELVDVQLELGDEGGPKDYFHGRCCYILHGQSPSLETYGVDGDEYNLYYKIRKTAVKLIEMKISILIIDH